MNDLERYKKLLSEFIKFRSISTDPQYKTEIEKTVAWTVEQFKSNGFAVETWQAGDTNPVIFAEVNVDPSAETVLVYGHYDVQPAEKGDGWESEPFTLLAKENKWYGRGVVDNKGQILIHMATVFELLQNKILGKNVKFLIEGNEETANPDIPTLVKKHADKLKSDAILVSDGELHGTKPAIEASLRGGLNVTVKFTTAKNTLHSGIYGGTVPNAAQELVKFLDKVHDDFGRVVVPGFHDEVVGLADEERALADPESHNDVMKITGVKKILVEEGLDVHLQAGLRPTIQVTGIQTGYTGDGYANIVPHTATAKLNFRLVANQDANDWAERFEKFVREEAPEYVGVEFSVASIHPPVRVDTKSERVQAVQEILRRVYEDEVATRFVGGGIPIVADFKEQLGVDTLLVPLVNTDCNMHGANENFDVDLIRKGLKFSEEFFSNK